MTAAKQNWEKVAARNVARLSPAQAAAVMARISAEGITIHHPDIQALTGGFNSQSINFRVMRLLGKRIKQEA